jgi:hypothetical protein
MTTNLKTLTDKEIETLRAIYIKKFGGDLAYASDIKGNPQSVGGILSSLQSKGVISVDSEFGVIEWNCKPSDETEFDAEIALFLCTKD